MSRADAARAWVAASEELIAAAKADDTTAVLAAVRERGRLLGPLLERHEAEALDDDTLDAMRRVEVEVRRWTERRADETRRALTRSPRQRSAANAYAHRTHPNG